MKKFTVFSKSGICKKEGNLSVSYKTVEEVLICPECNHRNRESAIVKADNSFLCSECHTTYPVLDGVIILMRRKLLKSLYPMMVQ